MNNLTCIITCISILFPLCVNTGYFDVKANATGTIKDIFGINQFSFWIAVLAKIASRPADNKCRIDFVACSAKHPLQIRAGQATSCWYCLPDLAARLKVHSFFWFKQRHSVFRRKICIRKVCWASWKLCGTTQTHLLHVLQPKSRLFDPKRSQDAPQKPFQAPRQEHYHDPSEHHFGRFFLVPSTILEVFFGAIRPFKICKKNSSMLLGGV